jgi:acyl-coenzyme A synthetase/AMP-(fatty) acid ligase
VTRALHGHQVGPFAIVRLARIPRNANGKIERTQLKHQVASALDDGR